MLFAELAIEQGRRMNPVIPREARICPCCEVAVEDEHHFLFRCPMYDDLRSEPRFALLFRAYVPGVGCFPDEPRWRSQLARFFAMEPTSVCAYLQRARALRRPHALRVPWLARSVHRLIHPMGTSPAAAPGLSV